MTVKTTGSAAEAEEAERPGEIEDAAEVDEETAEAEDAEAVDPTADEEDAEDDEDEDEDEVVAEAEQPKPAAKTAAKPKAGPAKAKPKAGQKPETKPAKAKAGKATRATEAEDDEDDEETGKVAGRRTLRLPVRLIAAVLALVFAAAVTTAVIQWQDAHRLSARDKSEQVIRQRSGAFGQALLAYSYTALATSRSRIQSLASTEFGQTYQTAFDGLSSVITKYQATATATVRDIYLNDFDGQHAKTLVVLDSEVKSTMGVRRVIGTKLMLNLIMEKGAWKVDGMTTLPADNETLTKPDGTVVNGQDSTTATTP